jgi:sulfoxide reductase heme-binding subunit YedZ
MTLSSLAPYAPWTNRRGKLCPLRLVVFLCLLLPAVTLLSGLAFGPVQAEPYEAALHASGDWAVRFLLLSLAVTPLRRIFSWNRIAGLRRMIGVSVLAYALLHLGLYAAQEQWNLLKVASEIGQRIYLTIGFVALLGLSVLGATSFDTAIRKLGRNWQRLHSLVYGIGVLALVHFFLQSKSDVTEPTLMAGLFVLLMLYRGGVKARVDISNPLVLAGGTVLAALGTAGIEFAWYALATGIPADRVFAANFDVATAIRPAVWVGLVGVGVAAAALVQTVAGLVGPKFGLRRV